MKFPFISKYFNKTTNKTPPPALSSSKMIPLSCCNMTDYENFIKYIKTKRIKERLKRLDSDKLKVFLKRYPHRFMENI